MAFRSVFSVARVAGARSASSGWRFASTTPTSLSSASSFSSSSRLAWAAAGAAGAAGAWAWASREGAEAAGDCGEWGKVREEVKALLNDSAYDDGSWGPVLVRLAWHASGTFDQFSNTGGSNGATMRFPPESTDGANNGLHLARARLEKIKANHPNLSYADIWTFAGSVAIEEMGGPHIDFRPGRTDSAGDAVDVPPNGRLPDALREGDHIRAVFYRMGFSDREIVALLGAHSLGRCHADRSGFDGPWTRAPTTFSNEFYRELLDNTWTEKKWKGPRLFQDPTGELIMLVADLALAKDPHFRQFVELYKNDEETFFRDFAAAWKKLIELGVPAFHAKRSCSWFGLW